MKLSGERNLHESTWLWVKNQKSNSGLTEELQNHTLEGTCHLFYKAKKALTRVTPPSSKLENQQR